MNTHSKFPFLVPTTVLVLLSLMAFGCQLYSQATPTPVAVYPLSCLTGTWRVDTASYVGWMNAGPYKTPTVLFTKIDPPFYYKFNEDGTFAIYSENVGLYFDATDPTSGKSAGTFETVNTGVLKGTISALKPDPANPGISLMTFNISENSVKMIDLKFNGKSMVGTPPNNVPILESSFFTKVGYACQQEALQLTPLAVGLPSQGYLLNRDTSWRPSTP